MKLIDVSRDGRDWGAAGEVARGLREGRVDDLTRCERSDTGFDELLTNGWCCPMWKI